MVNYTIRSRTLPQQVPGTIAADDTAGPWRSRSTWLPMSPARSIAARLLLSLTSVASFLLALEVVLRVSVAVVVPNVMVLDPVLGWRHRPDVRRTYYTEGVAAKVQTYAYGLRSVLPAPGDHRPRVLVVGDSFVDGLEVSDADHFVTLWARARPDLALINAGIGGYGTIQESLWLDEILPVAKPDRIVLVVDRTDLVDNVTPFYAGIGPRPYSRQPDGVVELSWEAFRPLLLPVPAAEWLHANSFLAYFVRNRLSESPWGGRIQDAAAAANRAVPEEIRRRVLSEEIARIAARGLPLTVVANARKGSVSGEEPPFTLREANVDLADVLRPDSFYVHDIHWNMAGHVVVAARLSQLP